MPRAFRFYYAEDPGAENGGGRSVIKRTEIMPVSGVPMGTTLKRDLIRAQYLGLRWRIQGSQEIVESVGISLRGFSLGAVLGVVRVGGTRRARV